MAASIAEDTVAKNLVICVAVGRAFSNTMGDPRHPSARMMLKFHVCQCSPYLFAILATLAILAASGSYHRRRFKYLACMRPSF
jgi:hypothetical protein